MAPAVFLLPMDMRKHTSGLMRIQNSRSSTAIPGQPMDWLLQTTGPGSIREAALLSRRRRWFLDLIRCRVVYPFAEGGRDSALALSAPRSAAQREPLINAGTHGSAR